MVSFPVLYQKSKGNKHCKAFCRYNGKPDSIDAKQDGQNEDCGCLKDQSTQEGNAGRYNSIVQGSKEGRTPYIEAHNQECNRI